MSDMGVAPICDITGARSVGLLVGTCTGNPTLHVVFGLLQQLRR